MIRIARSSDRSPDLLVRQPVPRSGVDRERSRGQVLVIFAGAVFLLMALMALVIDVSWYWANTLKIQRAADSAALAGAVWLPGDATSAATTARTEATKNGYTDGSGGVTVTPTQDTTDPRQLDVSVSAPVPTFFMRVLGINSINATRTSKGLYLLPVPMGSPLAYYGVGDYYVNTGQPPVVSTGSYTSTPTSGMWTTPNNAWTSGSSYTTATTSSSQPQAWKTLNFNTSGIGSKVTGVIVSFDASRDGTGNACTVMAEVSWNGTTWGNSPETTGALSSTVGTPYQLGSASDLTVWDTSGYTWSASDFGSSFQVRLTFQGSNCGTLSLNNLDVTVYSSAIQKVNVLDPNSTVLPSLGAWGAIITKGGNEQNGDAYAPANNGGSPFSGSNSLYNGGATNGGGYIYAINLPSAGGTVNVFDPGFCAMGGNPSGAGNLGAGDHWIGSTGTSYPVSTYYTLWNTGGHLGLDPSNWGTPVYTSGSLFESQTGYDPQNGSNPGSATSGCDAYHNTWWTIPAGSLPAGTYALQVTTTKPTDASKNVSASAENMFAIEVIGSGSPTIYGNGKMAVYNNLQPGNAYQLFYLARIDKNTGAGKTALIDIFDPGDVPGNAVLKVLKPDNSSASTPPTGPVQTQATFSYTTDSNCNATVNANGWSASDACSASNVSQITTSIGGHSSFNNTWIHIRIAIPSTYGSAGLWGPSPGGWWQIRYETPGGGNDTTTWQVSISGNPVHLVVP